MNHKLQNSHLNRLLPVRSASHGGNACSRLFSSLSPATVSIGDWHPRHGYVSGQAASVSPGEVIVVALVECASIAVTVRRSVVGNTPPLARDRVPHEFRPVAWPASRAA